MAFNPITSGEITSGKPVRADTQTKIKDNFDDHESRILAVETGASTVYQPIVFSVYGSYAPKAGTNQILVTTCNFNLTITGVFLIVKTAGSAGTTEIDVKYKRGAGSWTSVLTTKPTVAHSAGNFARSSNAVLDPLNVELEAGDLIAIDLTGAQTDANTFFVRVDFLKN